jgi:hypothetical protein
MTEEVKQIKSVLTRFQEGYATRNIEKVDSFMDELFAKDDNSIIIGTGYSEWKTGSAEIRELVENDWKEWEKLEIDIENAKIHVEGSAAWVATTAVCTLTLTMDFIMNGAIHMTQGIIGEEEMGAKEKMMTLLQLISRVLYEESRGKKFKYPLRLSAGLVKREDKWLIHQMHFSFGNQLFPDVRIIE